MCGEVKGQGFGRQNIWALTGHRCLPLQTTFALLCSLWQGRKAKKFCQSHRPRLPPVMHCSPRGRDVGLVWKARTA